MANQSALTIRLFQPADQAATRQLILTGLGEHFGVIDSSRNPDLDDITAAYVLPGHYFAVALVGDRLVGSGALVGEPFGAEPTGRLVRMSVDREHRRQGVGKALVEHLNRRSATARLHPAAGRDEPRLARRDRPLPAL